MGWDDLTVVQHRHFDRHILRSDKRDYQAPKGLSGGLRVVSISLAGSPYDRA
jgi:hypothetical protein